MNSSVFAQFPLLLLSTFAIIICSSAKLTAATADSKKIFPLFFCHIFPLVGQKDNNKKEAKKVLTIKATSAAAAAV